MQAWTATSWGSDNVAADEPRHLDAVDANQAQSPDSNAIIPASTAGVSLAGSRTTGKNVDIGSHSVPAVPDDQPTESDTELLAACELYDALTRKAPTLLPDPNCSEVPLDDMSCNEYAPIPTPQDYTEARLLSVEGWVRKTTTA